MAVERLAPPGLHSIQNGSGTGLLAGTDRIVWIEAGTLDLFLRRVENGVPVGALYPLGRRHAGQLVLETTESVGGARWALYGRRSSDAIVHAFAAAEWLDSSAAPATAEEQVSAVAEWLSFLRLPFARLAPQGEPLPSAGHAVECHAEQVWLGGNQRRWARLLDGRWQWFGRPGLDPGGAWVPVERVDWLTCKGSGTVEVVGCLARKAGNGPWFEGTASLSRLLVRERIAHAVDEDARQDARMLAREQLERSHLDRAFAQLRSVVTGDRAAPRQHGPVGRGALFDACRRLGPAIGIEFLAAPASAQGRPGLDPLSEIVEASRVRRRRVVLAAGWWRRDGVPMLGFRRADGAPVVLLPSPAGYRYEPPEGGPSRAVSEAVAGALAPEAWTFYRGLGRDVSGFFELLRFGSRGAGFDYAFIVALGLVIGLIGLITPMATGQIFDSLIPAGDRSQLMQLALGLAAAAFASALFEAGRGIASLRAMARIDVSVQSAIWDHLMRLPATFFRDYSAGDLAARANAITNILRMFSTSSMQTLMGAVFSVFNLALIFTYSVELALLALALIGLAVVVTVSLGLLRLRHERAVANADGELSGHVLQLLGGVAKLRAAGAEVRAFETWARRYAGRQGSAFRVRLIGGVLDVFNAVFPTLANLLIFATIAFHLSQAQGLSTGQFLAFNAAFGGFLAAILAATSTVMGLLFTVPIFERARPILLAQPEVTQSKTHPGRLSGHIVLSHVSFSYSDQGPPTLHDINLAIRPGEFIAIVGGSGAGKSTLLRILLGFERPTKGQVWYDNHSLSEVDLGALRRQLGVVLQNGQLMSGDLMTNIVGSSLLTLEDAWRAAERAGIADDIRQMPMGMHTLVSEASSTLSGGQRQRLMIARAIVHQPRILFFDEATSALDNRTQAIVSRSLDELQATRVVIAHRLSTIVNADRIVVMERGRIVQVGPYRELIAVEGPFADLARRQIL